MLENRYLLLSLLLLCLGTAFQFNGGAFGNPYLQQLAIVLTWLPVALVALRHYYYYGLTERPIVAAVVDATSQQRPPVPQP